MLEEIKTLNQFIAESNYIVFFGGAGVSTESGIPDFRSVDGLYSQKYKYSPEQIVSRSFFTNNTSEYYEFHRSRLLHLNAKPNAAHLKLAELEKAGKLKAIVTQNIDGLHQAAGSKCVLELHGSVRNNFCMNCRENYDVAVVVDSADIPHCNCGGIIKPDIVLFEEQLNQKTINAALNHISKADMLIIGGTSLGVYPAAGLIDYYEGNKLTLINKTKTHVDSRADLVIYGSIGEILGGVKV